MKPDNDFAIAVRARVLELSGLDMGGQFTIHDIFPGTDPSVTREQMIEAMAQSLVRMKDEPPMSGAPKCGPAIDIRELVKQLDIPKS